MPRRPAQAAAQTEIASSKKARTKKSLEERIAKAKSDVARLEAEDLAQRAKDVDPSLARAIRSAEHVAPYLDEETSETVRRQLRNALALTDHAADESAEIPDGES